MTDFSINKILFGLSDRVKVKPRMEPTAAAATELCKLQRLVDTHFDHRRPFADLIADILPYPDVMSASGDDETDSYVDVDSEDDCHHFAKTARLEMLSPPEWTRKQRHNIIHSGRYAAGQTEELNQFFSINRFPTSSEHFEIGKKLGLSRFQVKKWFQNRRAKERRRLRNSASA